MNTFDRYLLRRFWHVFAIGFIATYGLYVVFDAFSNADEFQDRTVGQGTLVMIWRMAQHYFFQAFAFFDLVGPILVVLATMAVFALLQRQSEIYPILSAGVPAWRLAVPIVIGTLMIVTMLIVNQELIVPKVADRLQAPRGTNKSAAHTVQTARDLVTHIEITGQRLYLSERKLEDADFLLPVPLLVHESTILRTKEAVQIPAAGKRPAGWRLKNVEPKFHELALTEKGLKHVFPGPHGKDVFVVTDVPIDQLHNRSGSYKYLSTSELVQRIRNPALGLVSIRSQTVHLHERLTRPLLVIMSVLVAIPLTMRRESRGLLVNLATCTAVLGLMLVLTQSSLYFGRLNIVSIDLAAWFPVVACGTCSAWLSGLVQT